MTPLAGKLSFSGSNVVADRQVLRISTNSELPKPLRHNEGYLVADGPVPEGFGWYIVRDGLEANFGDLLESRVAHLPPDFDYLGDGDVIRLHPARGDLRVLYRRSSPFNSFLLTERCNNLCLMCSQPPRNVDDGWIVDEIIQAIPLINRDTVEIMFTGGEPTLLGDRFLELVQATKAYLPHTALHVLSNGRNFAIGDLAARLGAIGHPDIMIGIPVYADVAHIHDYVVQADGAFDETIRGILNLKRSGVPVEIRVVLHKQTVPRLPDLATFITRNLLFVDHVALMGLEMTGFTKANLDDLWIDPVDYQAELKAAVAIFARARVNVSIYNSQLCLLDPSIRQYAKRSISDWKQEYMPECEGCARRGDCAGFFSSAKLRYSSHIRPFLEVAA